MSSQSEHLREAGELSRRDEDRLLLAREAWRAGQPDETDVHRAVERIRRSMRIKGRAPRKRRMMTVAVAFALFAALAFAGLGKMHWGHVPGGHEGLGSRVVRTEPAPPDPAATEAPIAVRTEAPIAVAPASGPGPLVAEEASEPAVALKAATPSKSRAAPRVRDGADSPAALELDPASAKVNAPTARVEASWRAVSEALEANKPAVAEQLLRQLAETGGDAITRGKATLGLAQMYAGRGDCERASELAAQVSGLPGVDAKTVLRAKDLGARCRGRVLGH